MKLCAIADEDNKIKILDIHQLSFINGWAMPRKTINCKTSIDKKKLIISNLKAITIWEWDGTKVHTIEMDATFNPNLFISLCSKLIVCDGTGTIIKFHVPELNSSS